ncbi:MAG: diguanylate cyclase [Leptolyngbya sp. SIO1D8]|nr:diguanylate cyclase [Leptolyngbya sp. SIO1D8]
MVDLFSSFSNRSEISIPELPWIDSVIPIPPALASLLEEVSDGVQIWDQSGKLLYANQAAAAAIGDISVDEYLNGQYDCRNWPAPILKDQTGALLPPEQFPFSQVLRGKSILGQIVQYVDQQNRDRCCAIKAFPIRDETGSLACGLIVSQDLTELHLTQQVYQQQQQQLNQIINAVPSMIAHLDAEERHCHANGSYLKSFGQAADTVKGKFLQDVIGPVIYQQMQTAIQQVRAGTQSELCLPMAGSSRPLQYKHVTLIPTPSDQGRHGFYLLFKDITAHKQVLDFAENQTQYFQHALEGAAVGIWDWDLITNEMMWSQQQERLFGLRPGRFDGNPDTFFALVDDRDRDHLHDSLQGAFESQKMFSAEFRIRLGDKSVRWLNHRGQVFVSQQKEPVRIAGIAFDITGQKAAEEKLRRQVNRQRLIAQISYDISHSNDLKTILQKVVSEVRAFLDVDRLVIIDLQDKMAGKATFEAHSLDVRSMLSWKLRHAWIVKEKFLKLYRQGHPVVVNDIHGQRFSEAELSFFEYFQISADLTVPLLENKKLCGLLSVHNRTPKNWQLEDRRLLETLSTQISTAFQRDKLNRDLTRANQELKRFAYLDGLTQVANRRRFEQFLHHEWRRLMREKAPLALIMADIDEFKAYNDLYGHQAGDDCLRRVAGTLSSAVRRPADMVARYGGEEFTVVLPQTHLEGATKVAEKIRILVRGQKILHEGSTTDSVVTLSLGVAAMYPHLLRTPDDLIQAADQALYRAKEAGRDRVVTASKQD